LALVQDSTVSNDDDRMHRRPQGPRLHLVKEQQVNTHGAWLETEAIQNNHHFLETSTHRSISHDEFASVDRQQNGHQDSRQSMMNFIRNHNRDPHTDRSEIFNRISILLQEGQTPNESILLILRAALELADRHKSEL